MLLMFYLLFTGPQGSEGCTLENHGEEKNITAYTGESVLLPCYCTELRAKPERFTWKRVKSSSEYIPIDIHHEGDKLQLFNSHSPGNLSLLISHLTEEDGGWYWCEAGGSGDRNINLTVEDSDSSVNYIYICTAVGASLLLIVLGGVFYWRYRAQRRGRTESQTGSRGGQETQDDALVLYATVNKQDTHQEEQEQDDVTYSTVVHNKPSTSAHTLLDTGVTTEYACIKRS
ncbi:uncharacterized protein [Hoplias malabaricus]|uniref:uncharacterized protein n=1 Tax=Hoplias malabaricus TaxID=27720 RepID=UPI003463498A